MAITAFKIRQRILKMANECMNNAHIGGSLSMVELLAVLYRDIMNYKIDEPRWEERDRFILSKGHCALALYAVLTECGFISEEEIETFLRNESAFGSHPVMDIEHGIESSTGSLGQGISLAVGIAKAAKVKGRHFKVYVLIGNGECNEGSVWEAIMLASQWKLDNLTVILDNNGFQSDGRSQDIIELPVIAKCFRDFGFHVIEVDGHDEKEIFEAFQDDCECKPKIIIGNTIKGKGVFFMENNNEWHHNRLTDEKYAQAVSALGGGKDE